jgi:hypothetical protein
MIQKGATIVGEAWSESEMIPDFYQTHEDSKKKKEVLFTYAFNISLTAVSLSFHKMFYPWREVLTNIMKSALKELKSDWYSVQQFKEVTYFIISI